MLFNSSTEFESRTLTIIGASIALVIVGVAGLLIVIDPFRVKPAGHVSIAIDTPYVGQGVAKGTALISHGMKVGQITAVSSLPHGGVRLNADLDSGPAAHFTDTFKIDFRPANYFGVTGVNLIPGTGGQALRNGLHLTKVPAGNFSLQALLSRVGSISNAALTPQLIKVIDRATRYTDALDPLIETAVITANSLANVQKVPTARLLTNATGLSAVLPALTDTLIDVGDRLDHSGLDTMTEDFYRNRALLSSDLGTKALFDRFGQLEGKHIEALFPFIEIAKTVTDIVPGLIRPPELEQELMQLRTRLEKLYGGTADQRAIQVRIVLDSLPGVAAPIAAIGGP